MIAVNFSEITTMRIPKAYKKHGKANTISAKKTGSVHDAAKNWEKDMVKPYVHYVWTSSTSIIPEKKDRQNSRQKVKQRQIKNRF
jgi:hypothetical protein